MSQALRARHEEAWTHAYIVRRFHAWYGAAPSEPYQLGDVRGAIAWWHFVGRTVLWAITTTHPTVSCQGVCTSLRFHPPDGILTCRFGCGREDDQHHWPTCSSLREALLRFGTAPFFPMGGQICFATLLLI